MYSRNLYRRNSGTKEITPPPNYGGTAYSDVEAGEEGNGRQGLDALAENDGYPYTAVFSDKGSGQKEEGTQNGIKEIASGLDEKRFDTDDLALAAVLLALLGTEKDDTLSLILLLMLL